MMAFLGPVSFQDGSGSWAAAGSAMNARPPRSDITSERANRRLMFIVGSWRKFVSRRQRPASAAADAGGNFSGPAP